MERSSVCHAGEWYTVLVPSELATGRSGEKDQTTPTICTTKSSVTFHKKVDSELEGTETKHQTLCHTQGDSKEVTTNTPEGQVVTRFGRVCKRVIRINM